MSRNKVHCSTKNMLFQNAFLHFHFLENLRKIDCPPQRPLVTWKAEEDITGVTGVGDPFSYSFMFLIVFWKKFWWVIRSKIMATIMVVYHSFFLFGFCAIPGACWVWLLPADSSAANTSFLPSAMRCSNATASAVVAEVRKESLVFFQFSRNTWTLLLVPSVQRLLKILQTSR